MIFKYPVHHSDALAIELGSSVSFLFSNRRQQLLRREVDVVSLNEAFNLIS